MADLIDNTEAFYTKFEPKQQNRFIMYIEGIPAFLVKSASLPSFTSEVVTLDHMNIEQKVKGKTRWNDMTLSLYDPIVPSGTQAVMEWFRLSHESVTGRDGYSDFYKKDITLKLLGPVLDVVSEWTIKGAWIVDSNFGSLDFSTGEAVMIECTISMDYAVLQF